MDGPNVNWKFLDEFETDIRQSEDGKSLLHIGSCGLHVTHGAFQTKHTATEWDLNGFLRASYWIFKDSPARRDDFLSITGSDIYPKKFCGHRWLENVGVVERALKLLPKLRKYATQVKPKPTCNSFKVLQRALADKFLAAKLEFFKSIAVELEEPYLRKYQSAKPLAPFLFDDLMIILKDLLNRVMKEEVVKAAKTQKSVVVLVNSLGDKTNQDLRPMKDIVIGNGARLSIPNESKGTKAKLEFFADCQQFLIKMITKLMERCPLKYDLVRYISALVPDRIASYSATSTTVKARFGNCVKVLLEVNRISSTQADKAEKQFGQLLLSARVKEKMISFDRNKDRLDTLYMDLIGEDQSMAEVWMCIKMLLLLSHGNSSVEGGFSVNNDLLVENLKERSVVGQRIVYDAIRQAGGHLSVKIDKEMMVSAHSSHSSYQDHIKKVAEADKQKLKGSEERKWKLLELQALQAKLQKVDEEKAELAGKITAVKKVVGK